MQYNITPTQARLLTKGTLYYYFVFGSQKKLLFSLQVSQCLHLILVYFKALANPG